MRRKYSVFKNAESLKFYNLAIWVDMQLLKKQKKDIADAIILKDRINSIYQKASAELDEILTQGGKNE